MVTRDRTDFDDNFIIISMIIDNISNISAYMSLNKRMGCVIDFISKNDLRAMPSGQYPIMGDDVFVNIQECAGKTKDDAVIEFHREMIDIQLPLTTSETYGYADVTGVKADDFDMTHDIGFLTGRKPDGYITCVPGMFAMFFPQDGHAPMIGDTSAVMKKAIFKVKA